MLAIVVLAGFVSGCSKKAPAETPKPATAAETKETTAENKEVATAPAGELTTEQKNAAVLFYQYSDTYISTVRSNFETMANAADWTLNVQDGQNNQATQNDQLDNVISQGAKVLLVNIVDMGAAQTVLDKAKAADLPLILFNREPTDIEVYKSYDKARFVGTRKEEAGIIQGEMIAKKWKEGSLDRNGNGKLDYVMLHGGLDNGEAVARTEFSVKAIKDAGIEVNEIGMQIAAWDTEKAKTAMDVWASSDLDNIDVVIANNDSMAIGAINALKAVGFNDADKAKHILVYGVDATEEAQEAIRQGFMDGTVKQDAEAMAKAMLALATNAAAGKDYIEGTEYKWDESGVAVRIPYQPFTGQ